LKAQVASVSKSPELKAVFKKILEDSKLLWAAKVKQLEAEHDPADPRDSSLATNRAAGSQLKVAFKKNLETIKLFFEAERILTDRDSARNGPNTPFAKKWQDRCREWKQSEKDWETLKQGLLLKAVDFLNECEEKFMSALQKAEGLIRSAALE